MNGTDTGFVLISAALVMVMTPGLALFYGGMVRAKSVLNMLMMSFISLGIVSILWVLYGYSLAFSGDQGGFIGNLDAIGLKGIDVTSTVDSFVASTPTASRTRSPRSPSSSSRCCSRSSPRP